MAINAEELRRYLMTEHNLALSEDDPVIALFLGHQAILDQYSEHWRDTVSETTQSVCDTAAGQLEALSRAQAQWSTELQRDLVKLQRDNLDKTVQKLSSHLKDHESAINRAVEHLTGQLKAVTWAIAAATGLVLVAAFFAW